MHFVVSFPSRSPAMGNLIKVLGKDLENCPHFFLDFESKWALGCVHVFVCLKCGSTCVQRRCSMGGRWERKSILGCASCWVVDGVMEWCLWVWFVIIRRSLVPLSVLPDALLSNDGINICCIGINKMVQLIYAVTSQATLSSTTDFYTVQYNMQVCTLIESNFMGLN